MKRYWKGSDLQIEINITDKKGNTIPFANLDELTIYLKTTGEEYVKVSKGRGIESDVDGNIYIRLNEHSLDYLPDGLLRYDARWKISAEGWDNGYDTVQSCETDIFVKTPDNYVPKANVQEKAVTYTANGDYVLTPDGSYEGMSKADIKVELPMESKSVTYTANGNYTLEPSEGYEGIQDVSIHIEIDTSEAENDGVMKFLRKQVTGKVELPIESMDTPYCLYKQKGLTEVVVPEGATTIPDNFFRGCTSLEKITYPDTITFFGSDIYGNIDYEKIMSFPLPPYLNSSLQGNIYYRDGEIFNVPKYINQFGTYSSPSFIGSYNNGIAKRLNFQGNFGQFYFQSFRAEEVDFRYNVQVPRFDYTSIYTGITKVIVPESLYNTWITTSPWSDYTSITESVPDTDYFIPYQTKSGNDINLTTGVRNNRYAVISSNDKKVCLRGTPWDVIQLFNNPDVTFVDFAAAGIEIPSFEEMFHIGNSVLTGCTLPPNKPLSVKYMFYDCESLITAPEMDTSNVCGDKGIGTFIYCSSLATIPEYDFRNFTTTDKCFYACGSLTNVGGFVGLKVSTDFSSSSLFTHDSLMNIINKVADVNKNPQTLTFGATNLAKLTDEEKAVATNKGWTLA